MEIKKGHSLLSSLSKKQFGTFHGTEREQIQAEYITGSRSVSRGQKDILHVRTS
jgi:hypothetical protein